MEAEKTKLISLLTDTIEKWLDVAPDYVVDLVHRFATYQIIWYGIWLAICLTIFGILIAIIVKWIREDEDETVWFCIMVAVVVLGITIWCFISFMQAIFVPEIALIHSL